MSSTVSQDPLARRTRVRSAGAKVVAGLAAIIALSVPSAAQAGTEHWAVNRYLGGGDNLADGAAPLLTGVYCHELDASHTRQIQINAIWASTLNWHGGWVQVTTHGLRSYGGTSYLHGACKNPHTVAYYFNAHDNY